MFGFDYRNPVRIAFGKGAIGNLGDLVPKDGPVLVTYGGGSVKANGVLAQVMAALIDRQVLEFGGIEPNPRYETLMRAVDLARREKVAFLLAVGGGSVLDGTKFVAAAIPFADGDPWRIVSENSPVQAAVPLGCVLTLPATGSEMNGYAVVSRDSTQEKLPFGSPLVYPVFSVLDPATSFSLPPRQVANGIVDTWVHVLEQYLTYPCAAPLQDRQAEAILLTLLEEGPKTLAEPRDYDARANLFWCATQALNGTISCGVPQDWSTHYIGHELTAFFGIDHAQSLAVVLPGVLRVRLAAKREKLVQYGRRVFGTDDPEAAIDRTEEFFRSLGVKTTLADYGIPADAADRVAARFAERGARLGEKEDMTPDQVRQALAQRVG
ncbi:MAG: iron-containing alcohol dehydrogenase [Magnetospirillum sp. WYHS-4]